MIKSDKRKKFTNLGSYLKQINTEIIRMTQDMQDLDSMPGTSVW